MMGHKGKAEVGQMGTSVTRWGKRTMSAEQRLTSRMLDAAAQLLVDAAHPSKIILFGSYAHDEQNADSDLDLLVVLPEVTNRFAEMVRLRRVLGPIRMPIDLLVYSEKDVKQR